MVRSVMIKGIEALVCECVLTGERAGVTEAVLATLEDTFPGFDWPARSAYMLERVMTHGVRRAAEMREVAVTVDGFGLDGAMSRACVEWQQRIGDLKLNAKAIGAEDYRELAAAIFAKLPARVEPAPDIIRRQRRRARSGTKRRCRRARNSRRDSWRDIAGDSPRRNRTGRPARSRS